MVPTMSSLAAPQVVMTTLGLMWHSIAVDDDIIPGKYKNY